jgi:hypothetical protein
VIPGLIAQHMPVRADGWTGTGASRAVDGKVSGASNRKASGADLGGRVKAAREAAGMGVPLTVN